MKKKLQLFLTVLFLLPVISWGQATYTWNVSSGDWTTAGNWTPSRDVPATNDVLVFDGSTQATPTVTLVPRETIGRLRIINNASVTFSTSTPTAGSGTISRSGTTVTGVTTSFTTFFVAGDFLFTSTSSNMSQVSTITNDTQLSTVESGAILSTSFSRAPGITITGNQPGLEILAGSSLTVSSSTPTAIFLKTGAIGSVSGNITFSGAAHRLIVADASGLTINNGATFTSGTSFSGYPFGTANLNSVIFASGSTYVFFAGGNPFGATAPNSVVTFQTGSLYSHSATGAPSLSNRTYANFEVNNNVTVNISTAFGNPWTVDKVEIKSGCQLNWTHTTGTGSGILNIKGDLIVAGTLSFLSNTSQTYTINFNGTSAQNISGAGTITLGSNLTGVVINNNSYGVTLQRSLSIPCPLILTNGNITTGSNTLTIGSSGSVSRTSGHIIGSLKKSSITGSQIFDVGTSSGYTPVGMTIIGTGDFTVQTVSGKHPNAVGGNVLGMYWTLTNVGITSADLQFTYLSSDVTGIESNYTIGKYSASTWTFPETSIDTGAKTASTAGVSSFSDFTLGESSALPVQLVSFSAYTNNKKVKLNWQTATEVNNYGFEVERSQTSNVKSEMWETIGFVNGYGNSNSPKNYSFTDEPYGGKEFKYRLKQIDFDGTFEYSDEVTAVFEDVTTFELEQNYPNPFNPSTKISYTIPQRSNVKLRVYNMLAQMEAELVNESQEAGHYQVIFIGSNLPSGTYFYKLEAGKFVEVKKFLLVK